jgi:hypothetical protein
MINSRHILNLSIELIIKPLALDLIIRELIIKPQARLFVINVLNGTKREGGRFKKVLKEF